MGHTHKVLDRIAKLMAIAAGEGEEARTAAHLAVKLMVAERVKLVLPPSNRSGDRTRPLTGFEDLTDWFSEAIRKAPTASYDQSNAGTVPPVGFEDLAELFRAAKHKPPWVQRPTDFYEPGPVDPLREEDAVSRKAVRHPPAQTATAVEPAQDPFDFDAAARKGTK